MESFAVRWAAPVIRHSAASSLASPSHTNEVKLCLSRANSGRDQRDSRKCGLLALFRVEKLVGAAEGEQFVGGPIDLIYRGFGDVGPENEAMLVA